MKNPLVTRLRLLTSLTETELRALEGAFHTTLSFAARADIALQGEHPERLHVVVDGWAARYRLLRDGRRHLPALLLPGDVCDLDGLLLQRVHSGVCALTDCTVAVLAHGRIRALMDQSPAIRHAFWWLMSAENAAAAEWSVSLGRRSSEERLAHLLCDLLVRLQHVGLSQGKGFVLPLIQADIADALGMSAVHVNRMLMELRGRNIIALQDRWLEIHDLAALRELAEFNPDYLHLEGTLPTAYSDATDPSAPTPRTP